MGTHFSPLGRAFRSTALFAITAFGIITSPVAGADTLSNLSIGQDIGYGGASDPRTIQSTFNNPSSPAAANRPGVWFGLGGVSAGVEFGDVSNFETRLDDISEALDQQYQSQSEAQQAVDEINAFIEDLGERGYAKVQARALPPLMPLGGGFPGLGGELALGVGAVANARIAFLDDPLTLSGPDGNGDYSANSDSSAYVKGAVGAVASLGYSSEALFRRDGELVLGARLNRYELELAKGVHALENEDESGDSADVADGLEDEFDRNSHEVSATGIDLGLIWKAERYRLGATVYNLNEPSFDYPRIGYNCGSLSGNEQNNCQKAQQFRDRVNPSETHTMERQLEVEAGVFTRDRAWSLTTVYDVNEVDDVVGDPQQWYALTGSYSSPGWWVPGFRVGYQANQAGSELSYYTAGLTLFRLINIDAAVSEQTVEVDDEEQPRSARVSVGLELFF